MNQDQVKEKLLQLESQVSEFNVIFSGKSSKKVASLYKPDSQEIILHNLNFTHNNQLMYAAIQEFAYHIYLSEKEGHSISRTRTIVFWDIFHRLLQKAESLGIYENIFEEDPQFIRFTRKIRENFLLKNGTLMKDFGETLSELQTLCEEKNVVFEDYVDRILGISRSSARSMLKVTSLNLDPSMGFEKMQIIANLNDPEDRQETIKAFKRGETQNMVKANIRKDREEKKEVTKKNLEAQKNRLEKSIEKMQERLVSVENQLQDFQEEEA